VPLLGNTNPSSDAKKHQQAFLAHLSGMDLKSPHLVIALRNANKRRCGLLVRARETAARASEAGLGPDVQALVIP
jgi:hypothetical protein